MELLKTNKITEDDRKILAKLEKFKLKQLNFDKCERCDMESDGYRFVVDGEKTDYAGQIQYRKLADEVLCDCCIDSFQNNYWDYGTLILHFGKEQAVKILQNKFRKMPEHIYKYLTRRD
jgi:hypothetical protein